ncbi:MAG: M16 family metallopeptidase [Myxococcaceae bacterium]
MKRQAAASSEVQPWTDRIAVNEFVLPNGLRVRLVPSPGAGVTSLYTFFRVGSRNERPGLTGISHLFEHMMFNGAKKYGPEEFDRVLESHGGQSNAYTSHDVTVYHEDFPKDALETVLDLESDRMASLRISDTVLENERQVVREERRLRVDNDPMGIVDEELHALAFQAHAYRWPVIGWMSDIEAIGRADCEAFFRTYYAPSNATAYLAGDFDADRARALFERYYRDIPAGPKPPPVTTRESLQRGPRYGKVNFPAHAPLFVMAFRGPAADSVSTLALDIAQFALSVGEGSRLVRELVYKKKVAVSAQMDWSWRVDPGLLTFYMELAPGADVRRSEDALLKLLDEVARKGFTAHEIQKAKNNLRAHAYGELSTQGGRAHALGNYEMYLGSWKRGLELVDAYAKISSAEVHRAVREFLSPQLRSVVELVPEAA